MATITSNPSATSLATPAAQQFVQSQLKPVPAYGSTVIDSMGRSGTAAFDPNTGNPLSDPNANTSTTTTPTPAPTQNDTAYAAYKAALSNNSGVSTAQSAYNDYVTNQSQSVAGLQGQGRGIPLTLIRGQQEKLLNQTNPEATRLQNQVGIEQTNRQAGIDTAKAGLDYATKQQELSKPVFGNIGTTGYQLNPATGQYESIGGTGGGDVQNILGQLAAAGVPVTSASRSGLIAALQGGATPQDIINAQAEYAGTKSAATTGSSYKFNPNTGQFEQPNPRSIGAIAGNALGNSNNLGGFSSTADVKAFQTAHGLTADGIVGPKTLAALNGTQQPVGTSTKTSTPLSSLSGGAYTLATTGDYQSGAYPAQKAAALAEVRKAFPDFNPAVAKANASAIADQTSQQADVSRGINAADSNFKLLTDTFSGQGVNDLSSPVANNVLNKIKGGLLGESGTINFNSAVSTLQTEYATVLGRGGDVTDSVRKASANVINGNYSISDLKSLHDYIDKEGKNVIDSYSNQIKNLSSGSTGSGGSSSGGTAGVTSSGIKYTISG